MGRLLFLFVFWCLPAFGVVLIPGSQIFTLSTGGSNSVPQVAVNTVGDALAVWSRSSSNQIQAAFFNHLTGQWAATAPAIFGAGAAPQVGIDSSGNGIAVWVTTNNQIQASRFTFTTRSWSTPVFITFSGFNITPKVSVATTGNALAVWLNFNSSVFTQVQSAAFDVLTGLWSAPVQISQNIGTSAVVGTNGTGSGNVVWQDLNSSSILTRFVTKG